MSIVVKIKNTLRQVCQWECGQPARRGAGALDGVATPKPDKQPRGRPTRHTPANRAAGLPTAPPKMTSVQPI